LEATAQFAAAPDAAVLSAGGVNVWETELFTLFATPYSVRIDKDPVTIEVTNIPTTWVNALGIPYTLRVDYTYGSSGLKNITVSVDGGAATPFNGGNEYLIRSDGTYTFTITGNNGATATAQAIIFNKIDVEPPRLDVRDGDSVVLDSGASVRKNVNVTAFDYAYVEITMSSGDANSDEIKSAFDPSTQTNEMTFSKNGTYVVRAFDDAGNITEFTFTINKPNYWLIALIATLGSVLTAAVVFLIVKVLRSRAAFKRLVDSTTVSDDSNKFVMVTRIK
jgi:hypothetical protein